MKEHVNFYENLAEAHIRLRYTVIMYDGLPYFVHAITDHRGDGVFRMYLEPVGRPKNAKASTLRPSFLQDYGSNNPSLGTAFDEWLAANPQSPIIRKKMNSPYFNKFRPFPLGMCNVGENAYYLERQPARQREQGLIRNMVTEKKVSLMPYSGPPGPSTLYCTDMMSEELRDCILGRYQTPEACLQALLDPEIVNTSIGFHREFALIRGPVGIIFLAYKEDVVGVLPNSNFSRVVIAKDFGYTREAVADLRLFSDIAISTK